MSYIIKNGVNVDTTLCMNKYVCIIKQGKKTDIGNFSVISGSRLTIDGPIVNYMLLTSSGEDVVRIYVDENNVCTGVQHITLDSRELVESVVFKNVK
jgi:hypothetical protein